MAKRGRPRKAAPVPDLTRQDFQTLIDVLLPDVLARMAPLDLRLQPLSALRLAVLVEIARSAGPLTPPFEAFAVSLLDLIRKAFPDSAVLEAPGRVDIPEVR